MRVYFTTGERLGGFRTKDEERIFDQDMRAAWMKRARANEDVGFLKTFVAAHIIEADLQSSANRATAEDFIIWFGRDLSVTVLHKNGRYRPEIRIRATLTKECPLAECAVTTPPLDTIEDVIAKVQEAYDVLYRQAVESTS